MKKHISLEQYESLNEETQQVICKYAKWSHGNSIVWMQKFIKDVNIGVLIELLKENDSELLTGALEMFKASLNCGIAVEYCFFDNLFEAVEQCLCE